MSSPESAGNYKDHVNALVQKKPVTSFLQSRSTSRRNAAHKRAQELLQQQAKALNSRTLSGLVMQMRDSPFAKLIDMTEALIAKLKQEAAEEAEHKAFCDEELKKNKLKRDKLTSESEELATNAAQRKAAVAEMADTIERLGKEQVDLNRQMQEATAARQEEKTANLDAIKDSKIGRETVKNAISVLREFYEKQGEALLQRQVP